MLDEQIEDCCPWESGHRASDGIPVEEPRSDLEGLLPIPRYSDDNHELLNMLPALRAYPAIHVPLHRSKHFQP